MSVSWSLKFWYKYFYFSMVREDQCFELHLCPRQFFRMRRRSCICRFRIDLCGGSGACAVNRLRLHGTWVSCGILRWSLRHWDLVRTLLCGTVCVQQTHHFLAQTRNAQLLDNVRLRQARDTSSLSELVPRRHVNTIALGIALDVGGCSGP